MERESSIKKGKIKFDLASNFDNRLIEEVGKIGTVSWVYGKMNTDLIGGGRPAIVLPKFSWEHLKEHINTCHKNNIKFNYLINALCIGNKEFQKDFNIKLVKSLEMISESGADGVTVASPYLCRLIKKQFPNLFVSVSIYTTVNSLEQVKYWEEMGADEVTLSLSVNRDFKKLKDLLLFTRGRKIILRLLANNICLHNCPYVTNHACAHSHASRKGDFSSKFHIDYQLLSCYNHKISNPAKLISATWIRPEDVCYYEALCEETGNYNLSLKLMERDRKTDWLLRVINAYSSRSYDGNLLDLTNFSGKNVERKQVHSKRMYLAAITHRYNMKKVSGYRDAVFAPPICIDNKKLDGFIEHFKDNYACNESVCFDANSGIFEKDTDFKSCSYCSNWAKKAVTFDETLRNSYLEKSRGFLDALHRSDFF